MTRRALIVGVDTYDELSALSACASDTVAVAQMLARHSDNKPNYDCRTWPNKTEDDRPVTRKALRAALRDLFENTTDELLLYFSGHGVVTNTGAFLCTTDAAEDDWGISMGEIITLATASRARDIILLLDCCHAGDIANSSLLRDVPFPIANIREDMTILAAARTKEAAHENGTHGLFTAALLDALKGGAADHMGWVTASAMYAYVQRRFGGWTQRPVYKSHATMVNAVRECAPLIERLALQELTKFFPTIDHRYPLDPEHEPEDEHGNIREPRNQAKMDVARRFKEYRDAGLLKPSIPGEQLYWTARRNHTVELTARGHEYWWLVKNEKI
jgi:hypothetical protein